ncbi:ribonuclease H-like domain-containing protein [Tanacetum coccineum]
MLQDVKSYLGKCFAMKDLGEAAYILGIKICRDRSKRLIGLYQSAYIKKILKRYYIENSKRGTIPMQEKLKLSKSDGASTPAEKRSMSSVPYASAVGLIMAFLRSRSGRSQGRRSYGDNGRSNAPTNESSPQVLVAQDGLGGYDWSNDFEEESSKNLDEILNSQISARDKTGLGYSTQLNDLSCNHETNNENSFSVFYGRSSDEDSTPANDKSSQADGYKAVPPSITGNFLTPRADISFAGLDEYAIRNKIIESQTSKLNNKTSDPNTVKPKSASESVVSNPKINRDRVIIEDWNSDDEEEVSEMPVSTVRLFAPKIAQTSGAIRPIYPRMDNVRPRGSCSPIKRSYYTKPAFRPKDLKQDVKTFGVQNMTTAGTRAVVNTGKGKMDTDLKKSRWVWRPKGNYLDHVSKDSGSFMLKKGNPEILLQDHAVVDSGCSSHMTGNKAYLSDYEDFNGGFVAFGSDPKGGKITGKGKIKTANLDFDDVYFVDELKFNLFSVSQMCDKKNSVLFTESGCLILSPSFKLLDESQVVLRAPRKDDVYSLDLKNIVPSGGITCLYVNATADESKLWHMRLGHVNFKNINKLVKGHLVRG